MANQFLDKAGVTTLWAKIKALVNTKENSFTKNTAFNKNFETSTSNIKQPGTVSVGTNTNVARADHVHPAQTDVTGNAGSATKLATARTIDGVSFNGSTNITHFCECNTSAETADKIVSLTNFAATTGASVKIKFTVTNKAGSPTLNINNTGAKPIRYRGSTIEGSRLAANRIYEFVYDGANYELVGDVATRLSPYGMSNSFEGDVTLCPTGAITLSHGSGMLVIGTDLSSYALKTDITNAVRFKGTVATASTLPTTGQKIGDLYNITAASDYGVAGTNVVWDGAKWDSYGSSIQMDAITTAELNAICV